MSTGDVTGTPQLLVRERVATIVLSKPDYANRLSPNDLAELRRHVAAVNEDERVLVLRFVARGRYFCSGYDISSLADADAPSSLYFGETMDAVEQARPVTIAAIQGGVYGGGTDLALACDFRIGSDAANMFMPATRLGLHFYPGGLQRYVSRLGVDTAKRLFLTAEKLDAEEMLRIGFLTERVEASGLEARLEALTAVLLDMAPIPLIGVKRHLNLIARGVLLADEIDAAVRRSEQSFDIAEGARAWKEKRPPRFTGG
ncbi:enoyl-CoA hydratase/isomerase family protein [Alcaligenaceae bacterium]|nr:enoyl-CoA hydratase/isomerase family protein [Alcaligenaceae bacterium]